MDSRKRALLALEAHRIAEAVGDDALAREMAAGTCRRRRTLDWWINQVAKLPKKKRERNLLRLTLYQIVYMRTPTYAAIDEGVKLAKELYHPRFAAFLNATMRKLAEGLPELPDDLGIKYSYPDWFIERVQDEKVLDAMNQPPKLMARRRPELIPQVVESVEPGWVVQNITQAELLKEACDGIEPKSILDLCAAPGGKLRALADRFPNAELLANDVKPMEGARQGRGEEYPLDQQFDLVVADVPCSNSGVLGKRPEARWRLTGHHLGDLQEALVTRAALLVAPGGSLLYMTCSILEEENRVQLDWPVEYERTILPDGLYDGGYAIRISR